MKKSSPSKVIPLKPRSRHSTDPETQKEEVKIEYEEILTAPSWVRLTALGVFLVVVSFVLIYPFVTEGGNDFAHLLLAVVFTLVGWLIQIFLSLKVTITNSYLQFGFYLFSKRIAYQDILDCSVIRYSMADFLGWGIRKGGDGCTLYNIPGDQQIAVKVTILDEQQNKKYFAFSAKRPQVIQKKIQNHLFEAKHLKKTQNANMSFKNGDTPEMSKRR